MVFPPLPLYLDPPNWSQQHQGGANHDPQNPNLPPPPHPGGDASIRAISTAERARMAKIPMAEGPLKCPRCDSINTKFCYFNNYSLSQPRHFCKSCRRYWTRGGALRSVPVGGGCRRSNKRRKTTTSRPKTQEPITPSVDPPPTGGLGSPPSRLHEPAHAQTPPFPFMANSHLLGSLNFGDHVPFLGGFGLGLGSSPAASVFPFFNEGVETASFGKSAAVKAELNLSSQVVDEGQFWSSNGGLWTDVSGMSSSSAAVDDHNRRHDHRNI